MIFAVEGLINDRKEIADYVSKKLNVPCISVKDDENRYSCITDGIKSKIDEISNVVEKHDGDMVLDRSYISEIMEGLVDASKYNKDIDVLDVLKQTPYRIMFPDMGMIVTANKKTLDSKFDSDIDAMKQYSQYAQNIGTRLGEHANYRQFKNDYDNLFDRNKELDYQIMQMYGEYLKNK